MGILHNVLDAVHIAAGDIRFQEKLGNWTGKLGTATN